MHWEEDDSGEYVNVDSINYGLEYLKNICLFSKLDKKVEIHISKDYPIKLQYSLDDWTNDINEDEDEEQEAINFIRFFVAPSGRRF